MKCDDALEALSAAFDGELPDDDSATQAQLDEHIESCEDCKEFQGFSVDLRARLRFEAVDATPDVASGVIALLTAAAADDVSPEPDSDDAESEECSAEDDADADDESDADDEPAEISAQDDDVDADGEPDADEPSTETGTGDADVASLPLWRRARAVMRGNASPNGARTDHPAEARSLIAAVAAAVLVGAVLGAAFVGVGHDAATPAWAEDLPEQVVEAQHDITSLDADIVVAENGRPDHDESRTFEGHLSYEAPERLALELAEVRSADAADDEGSDGPAAAEGDVRLLVRDDRWWLSTVRSCATFEGETSCPPEGSEWTREVTGREAFSDAAPIPLELIGPVDSFTLAATPPVLGERAIADRTAVGVRVPAAQVAQFLAALSPGDDLRTVHPSDPVDVWLDRDDLVPLAVEVHAARSDERTAWAATHGYREDPGDQVLSFLVTDISVNQGVPDDAFDWPEDGADEEISAAGGNSDDADPEAGDDGSGAGAVDTTTTTDPAVTDDGAAGDDEVPTAEDGSSPSTEEVTGDPGTTPPADETGSTTTTTTTTSVPAGLLGRHTTGGALVQGLSGALGLGGNGNGSASASSESGAPGATTSTTTSSPTATTDLPSRPTSTTTTSTTVPDDESATTTTTTELDDDLLGDDAPVYSDAAEAEAGAVATAGGTVVEGQRDSSSSGSGAGAGVEAGEPVTLDNGTIRDDGFRAGDAGLAPEPSALPGDMEPHLAGTTQAGDGPAIGVRSWTDGRAWVKVRATEEWEGPRLFGDLGSTVRSVDLGDAGQGYVSADGRTVALHTDDLDVVLCGSLPTDQLVEMAASLGVVGEPVPRSWPESTTATLGEARAEEPGLLVPDGLEGFAPPAVGITSGSITQLYVGPGDRAFSLTRSDTPNLAPPSDDDSMGVDVRGTAGRYSVSRGELEWTEGGASYSLQSATVPLSELLTIADGLAPGTGSSDSSASAGAVSGS